MCLQKVKKKSKFFHWCVKYVIVVLEKVYNHIEEKEDLYGFYEAEKTLTKLIEEKMSEEVHNEKEKKA